MSIRAVVKGVGAHLPAKILTNHEIAKRLDTSHEWIVERTGIHERHIAAEGEHTSDLGVEAAKRALENAKLSADDIDLVVLATTTPDETMPATATKIQHRLGIKRGAAFDVNAACSGFVYALNVADAMLRAGSARRALVIGAETYSRILNWEDRGTCILFGDGAGAMVLEAEEQPDDVQKARGILFSKIYSDGQYTGLLATTGGVSSTKEAGTLFMSGKEIFRHATAKMSESIKEGLGALGFPLSSVDWLVPHQANIRILHAVAQKIGLPEEKAIISVDKHANTSAASIPLALNVGLQAGKIKQGQIVALAALGAGLTWGSCIIRW